MFKAWQLSLSLDIKDRFTLSYLHSGNMAYKNYYING